MAVDYCDDTDDTSDFVQEDNDDGDDDELQAVITSHHEKFVRGQVARQESLRASRPWSAPPLMSPRPEQQRAKLAEAEALHNNAEGAMQAIAQSREIYEPPESRLGLQAGNLPASLAHLLPARPQSAGHSSTGRPAAATGPNAPGLQDILEDSPLDLAPGHEISAAILDSGRLLSYLPESGPDADAPDDASYIEDTCLPVDDDLYDQVGKSVSQAPSRRPTTCEDGSPEQEAEIADEVDDELLTGDEEQQVFDGAVEQGPEEETRQDGEDREQEDADPPVKEQHEAMTQPGASNEVKEGQPAQTIGLQVAVAPGQHDMSPEVQASSHPLEDGCLDSESESEAASAGSSHVNQQADDGVYSPDCCGMVAGGHPITDGHHHDTTEPLSAFEQQPLVPSHEESDANSNSVLPMGTTNISETALGGSYSFHVPTTAYGTTPAGPDWLAGAEEQAIPEDAVVFLEPSVCQPPDNPGAQNVSPQPANTAAPAQPEQQQPADTQQPSRSRSRSRDSDECRSGDSPLQANEYGGLLHPHSFAMALLQHDMALHAPGVSTPMPTPPKEAQKAIQQPEPESDAAWQQGDFKLAEHPSSLHDSCGQPEPQTSRQHGLLGDRERARRSQTLVAASARAIAAARKQGGKRSSSQPSLPTSASFIPTQTRGRAARPPLHPVARAAGPQAALPAAAMICGASGGPLVGTCDATQRFPSHAEVFEGQPLASDDEDTEVVDLLAMGGGPVACFDHASMTAHATHGSDVRELRAEQTQQGQQRTSPAPATSNVRGGHPTVYRSSTARPGTAGSQRMRPSTAPLGGRSAGSTLMRADLQHRLASGELPWWVHSPYLPQSVVPELLSSAVAPITTHWVAPDVATARSSRDSRLGLATSPGVVPRGGSTAPRQRPMSAQPLLGRVHQGYQATGAQGAIFTDAAGNRVASESQVLLLEGAASEAMSGAAVRRGLRGTAAVEVGGTHVSVYVSELARKVADANRWLGALGSVYQYRLKRSTCNMRLEVYDSRWQPQAGMLVAPDLALCAAPAVKDVSLAQFLGTHARLKAQRHQLSEAQQLAGHGVLAASGYQTVRACSGLQAPMTYTDVEQQLRQALHTCTTALAVAHQADHQLETEPR